MSRLLRPERCGRRNRTRRAQAPARPGPSRRPTSAMRLRPWTPRQARLLFRYALRPWSTPLCETMRPCSVYPRRPAFLAQRPAAPRENALRGGGRAACPIISDRPASGARCASGTPSTLRPTRRRAVSQAAGSTQRDAGSVARRVQPRARPRAPVVQQARPQSPWQLNVEREASMCQVLGGLRRRNAPPGAGGTALRRTALHGERIGAAAFIFHAETGPGKRVCAAPCAYTGTWVRSRVGYARVAHMPCISFRDSMRPAAHIPTRANSSAPQHAPRPPTSLSDTHPSCTRPYPCSPAAPTSRRAHRPHRHNRWRVSPRDIAEKQLRARGRQQREQGLSPGTPRAIGAADGARTGGAGGGAGGGILRCWARRRWRRRRRCGAAWRGAGVLRCTVLVGCRPEGGGERGVCKRSLRACLALDDF